VGKTVTFTDGSLAGADAGNYLLTGGLGGTSTATITPLAITTSGISASNKVYNQDTTAELTISGAVLHGVLGTDSVNLNAGSAVGHFADKNVGVDKGVIVNGLVLSGVDAGNYTVSNVFNTTASITARSVSITGTTGQDKVYDGTVSAIVSGGYVSGVLTGDVVSLSALSGQFANKNVGINMPISLVNPSLGGADAGNYKIVSSDPVSASITPAPLTISGITASDKTYDGTTGATVSTANVLKSGLIGSDVVTMSSTGTFANKNVAVGKDVTLVNIYGGADAGNYSITDQTITTATITPYTLTVNGITASSKIYDSTTKASLDVSNALPIVALGLDDVTLNLGTAIGSFADKNVGNNKPVTVSFGTPPLTGADAGNYTITDVSNATASIKPLGVTIAGATAQDKVYDGTVNATLNGGSVNGVLAGDVVSLAALPGQFADKNVLYDSITKAIIAKTVSLNNPPLGGPDGGNYFVTSSNAVTANITQKPIGVIGAVVSDKVYDATVSATVTGGTLSGVVANDVVTLTGQRGTFSDKNAGVGKTVTFTDGSLAGADAGNYLLTGGLGGTSTATITPRPVFISGKTIAVAADQLKDVVLEWSHTDLADSDAVGGVVLTPSTLDVNAKAGTVLELMPSGGVITVGLDSNYDIKPPVAGYVVVLPSKASAQAGGGGNSSDQNVFYLQVNKDEIKAASQALDQQRPAVPVANQEPTVSSPAAPEGNRMASGQEADREPQRTVDYRREIKESTPSVIKDMRTRPLLLWDEKSPGASINLSDSGVSN
jgi:hypothetical protein